MGVGCDKVWLCGVAFILFAATGLSFTGVMVITSCAVSHRLGDPLSHTLYVKVSLPVMFAFGVYVYVPFALRLSVPLLVVVITENVKLSFSVSVSFVATVPEA